MKSNPFVGRYFFHFHTSFTDGKLTVSDYFDFAARNRIDSLIFLEHIRKVPTYDAIAFTRIVRELAETTGVQTHLGFEAKLMPGGGLDIGEETLKLAEVIGIAEHGFPDDRQLLESSFSRTLDQFVARMADKTFVWVHPGLWLKKRRIGPKQDAGFGDMLKEAQTYGVRIERNLRYGLVSEECLPGIASDLLVVGADAHVAGDLQSWSATK